MSGFILNKKNLNETHEITDLLDFSAIGSKLQSELDLAEDSSIVGFVGAFGTGKSTTLHNLSAKQKSQATQWAIFDAWKFPERNNLWEGFVLELVKSIKPKLFDSIRKKIDGKGQTDIKSLIKVLFQGANIFIPGASIGENLTNLFQSSGAKRVFEFQEILENFINHEVLAATIYIVVEDIDRSGDKGVFFLETLKQFLRSSKLNKKVVIIVPISDSNFAENQDSYYKCLDYIHYFEPKYIDFVNFINETFDPSFFEGDEWIKQLNFLFRNFISDGSTLRQLKIFLRNANINYSAYSANLAENIDVRIFLFFSLLHQRGEVFLRRADLDRHEFIETRSWAKHFLVMVANKISTLDGYSTDIPFIFVNNIKLKTPNYARDVYERAEDKDKYFLSNLYIETYNFKLR